MRRPFRTRNPERDRQNDAARLAQLQQVLSRIGRELAVERDGFAKRYKAASADAAFSQERLEDGQQSNSLSARVDDLTNAIIDYSRRIATLDKQIGFIAQLREDVAQFAAGNGLAMNDDAGPEDGAT